MSITMETNRMEPLDADGFPQRRPVPPHQPTPTIPVPPIQTTHPFPPSQLTPTSTTTPISATTTTTTTTSTTTTTTNPNESTSLTRPPISATGPFSFPALHLGSFSSLRIDDFADYPSSSPVDRHPGPDEADETQPHSGGGGSDLEGREGTPDRGRGQGGLSLGLPLPLPALGSPTKSGFAGGATGGTSERPSPTLYDVTRMARSGSPFRPIGNLGGGGLSSSLQFAGPSSSSTTTGFGQGQGVNDTSTSEFQARVDGRTKDPDYLIDSPGFLSEEGSKTFFRQSQVVRRRTVVSGGVTANRADEEDEEDEDAAQGEERMNDGEGRRVGGVVVGEGVGLASRKASAVGDVEGEEQEDGLDEGGGVLGNAGIVPGSFPTQNPAPPPHRPSIDGPRFPSSSSMDFKQRRRLPSAPSARSISSGQIEGVKPQQEVVNGSSSGQPIDLEEKRRQAQSVFDRTSAEYGGLGQPLSSSTMMDNGGQARATSILPSGALHPDISSSGFSAPPVVPRSFSASQVPQNTGMTNDLDRSRRASNTAGRTPPKAHVALPSIQDRANASPNLDALPSFPMFPAMDRDEGPYPSYARPRKSMEPEDPVARRSDARLSNGKYRPGADGVPLRVKVPPPQEEICLECLMRDRDLMHVDVLGEGVWERASDVDWQERLEREDMCVQQFRRDPDNRRKRDECEGEARARLESMLLREEDALVTREVRWRGFSWEEGPDGTGLPRHFRGHVGGELLEERLKELASKMSAPAAHRFKTLQVYLRDQALSVGLIHPTARRAELDAGMSRQSMVSPPPGSGIPRAHDPNLRVSQSQGVLHESADYNRGPVPRRPQQHSQYLDPAQRSTMYAKPVEEPTYQHGQGPLYTRSKTIPAIALGSSLPARDHSPHARAPPVQLDLRKGRGISSPGLLEGLSPDHNNYDDPSFNDRSSARYDSADQASLADSQIRPFSFAVWAGNGQHSARSSPGPGGRDRRNSALGRWGGSVTSFFGGSQGGASGSMMDMHLGLDQDRRRGMAPSTPQPHPRSVSMASPPRPNFFSRASASFQNHSPILYQGQQGNTTSTSDSASFVDERRPAEPAATEKPKKKGFKGFLQKLGGSNKKRPSSGSGRDSLDRSIRTDDDYASPLPPPPSLSMLVERSDRRTKHNRTPSNSSLSGPPTGPGPQAPYANGRQSISNDQMQPRSVSAPIVESPSKTSLPSASPTSSRYPYGREYSSGGGPSGAYKRDSYASSSTGRRRSSNPGLFQTPQDAADDRRMGATIEVLEGDDVRGARSSAYAEDSPQFANARFSQDRGGPGSMTNSSGTILAPSIETPMMGQPMGSPYYKADGDRQKNLPPLPPSQTDYAREDNSSPMRSPDSFNAFFGQGVTMSTSTPQSPYQSHGRVPSSGQRSFTSGMSLNKENNAQQPRKTKSKFGLKGLFSAGSKNDAAQMDSRADERYSQGPYDRNDFEDLSRAKSAGPQWAGQAPASGLPSILQTARPMRQPYDERTRRTYYQ